ncbi:stalk domain-containing protein [Paenibacillus sp. FA6]|uniref:stalk domain-containing protein n=1 Tax=Paenibacillus sp. FA6 TaxID=3413029 RepID=UPI003F65BE02
MRSKKKLIISLTVVLAVFGAFGAGAYAAQKITLIVNGGVAKADIRTINNTTYVPLRAVSELLGASVAFDSKTQTITIVGGEGSTETITTDNTVAEKTKVSTRQNPAKIGQEATFHVSDFMDDYKGTISISEVVRGEQAWNLISEANQFNSAPKDGYEYILAKINIGVTENKKTDAYIDVNSVNFKLVSTSGTDYDFVSVVEPDPSIDSKIYVGSSNTGWAAFEVKKSDQSPLITYGRKYDGTGGVWFKTTN